MCAWISLAQLTVGIKANLTVTNELTNAIHSLGRYLITILETESPEIDQRCNRDVKGTIGVGRYFLSLPNHGLHVCVSPYRLVIAIHAREYGRIVEHRQRTVKLPEQHSYRVVPVLTISFINYVVGGIEYLPHKALCLIALTPNQWARGTQYKQ